MRLLPRTSDRSLAKLGCSGTALGSGPLSFKSKATRAS